MRITFRCLPIMFPRFPIIIAVFQRVSPWLTSLSRIGFIMTMLYFRAYSWRNCVDSPSTGSANSHHLFSRVQNANGIIHASWVIIIWEKTSYFSEWTIIIKIILNLMSQLTCKHNMLTPEAPAESMIGFNFWKIALFWSNKGAVVGRATEFWMRPTLTTRGSRTNSLSASKEKAWKF